MGQLLRRYGVTAALTLAVSTLLVGLWYGVARPTADADEEAAARQTLAALDRLQARLAEAVACRCSLLQRADAPGFARLREAVEAGRQAVAGGWEDGLRALAEKQLALLERSAEVRQHHRFDDRRQVALTEQVGQVADSLRRQIGSARAAIERDLAGRSAAGWTSAGRATAAACLAAVLAAIGLCLAGAARREALARRKQAAEQAERLALTQAALDQLAALQTGLEGHFREAQRLASVGRVTSEVIHDFNNLLSVILACSEATLQELPADHPSREVLRQAVEAGHRAAALTRRVLSVGRGQGGSAGPCELNPVVAELEPILRRVAGRNVETRLELADRLPAVRADRTRLEQVLLNLTANARDAMPLGGTLAIRTALGPGGRVLLEVADSGVGMDAATKARVFEPFFTTKDEGKGTGLGMAIVRDAVAECGGGIEVDSDPGRGTRVRVYLCPAA